MKVLFITSGFSLKSTLASDANARQVQLFARRLPAIEIKHRTRQDLKACRGHGKAAHERAPGKLLNRSGFA